MLPDINLDHEYFQDIVNEAKNKIASLYPEWTDYNYHDPGITMIELFAWLKEIQQFYLNQISIENKISYLKILGVTRLRKKPAIARVNVDTQYNFILPQGVRMYAGNICFETKDKHALIAGNISKCIIKSEDIFTILKENQLGEKGKLKEYPFGQDAKEGNEFYIGFHNQLPSNTKLSIYINIDENMEVIRNPIDEEYFEPLAELKYEYYSKEGWKNIIIQKDKTYAFIQDGNIEFFIEDDMEEINICDEKGYYIRITVKKAQYDTVPILLGISINTVEVKQEETLFYYQDFKCHPVYDNAGYIVLEADSYLACHGGYRIYLKKQEMYIEIKEFESRIENEVLKIRIQQKNIQHGDAIRIVFFMKEYREKEVIAYGNGFPNQTYDLEDTQILYNEFEIIVFDSSENSFREWHKVDSFQSSNPTDKHYMLDEKEGNIVFGNGFKGIMPEGEIRMIHYVRSYGSTGNVKAKKISTLYGQEYQNIKIYNDEDAYWGGDSESLEQCFNRFQKKLKNNIKMVTAKDYEYIVKKPPGLMIEACKVLNAVHGNIIEIVVKPFTTSIESKLSEAYYHNICNYLEDKRMIGTKIKIISPKYVQIFLFMEVEIMPHYIHGKLDVRNAIEKYFKKLSKKFGENILHSDIYSLIDSLDCVSQVISVTINGKGDHIIRNKEGDIIMQENGIGILKDVHISFTTINGEY